MIPRFPVLLAISRLLLGIGILVFVVGLFLAVSVAYAHFFPREPQTYYGGNISLEGKVSILAMLWAGYIALVGVATVALAEVICVLLAVEENIRIFGMKVLSLAEMLSESGGDTVRSRNQTPRS